MRKQTVGITLWLALPFAAMTLLMVWIFTSLDKERLMDDAVPVGAGAGDTGNANAIGQLFAGRDPDLIDRALTARREGREIDPTQWPGGVRLRFPVDAIGADAQAPLIAAYDPSSGAIVTQQLILDGQGWYAGTLTQRDVEGRELYASSGPVSIASGVVKGPQGRELYVLVLDPRVAEVSLQASDPMVITFEVDSVFVD